MKRVDHRFDPDDEQKVSDITEELTEDNLDDIVLTEENIDSKSEGKKSKEGSKSKE